MPNLNALAMEPLGRVAGLGASLVGFWTLAGGAAIAGAVSSQMNGDVVVLTVGLTLIPAAGLFVLLVTERGRLFGRDDVRGAAQARHD